MRGDEPSENWLDGREEKFRFAALQEEPVGLSGGGGEVRLGGVGVGGAVGG